MSYLANRQMDKQTNPDGNITSPKLRLAEVIIEIHNLLAEVINAEKARKTELENRKNNVKDWLTANNFRDERNEGMLLIFLLFYL